MSWGQFGGAFVGTAQSLRKMTELNLTDFLNQQDRDYCIVAV